MKSEENNENEFLSELSPLLFNKRISVDAEPPEGYFDQLPADIMTKIQKKKEYQDSKDRSYIRFVNYRNLAIAAAAAVLLALLPFFKSHVTDPPLKSQMNAVGTLTGIEDNDLSAIFDENDLYDALSEKGVSQISTSHPISDEEIINYLIREDYSDDLILENY